MRSLVSMVVMAVLLFPLTAVADVQGPVWGVWPGPDTVYINGEVWVPPGSTLVIEPRVVVLFEGHYKFRVDSAATLIAVGAPDDSIVFTPADTATGWHGIRFYSASDACSLCYCRIEYGKATGSGEDTHGGAIYCSNSSPTISRNNISDNSAGEGGAIFCNESSPAISNNTISGNLAFGQINSPGGGIYCGGNSNPIITGNTISDNTASGEPYGPGGGIFCSYSNPTISDNTINSNSASCRGGGIFCDNSSPTIENNTIEDNSTGLDGGGIYVLCNSNPLISWNIIRLNRAGGWGGAICAITNDSYLTIIHNIIVRNEAYLGGGIAVHYQPSGYPIITNNTIAYNEATGENGGGICSVMNSNPRILNTIICRNTPDDIGLKQGGTVTITYSDVCDSLWPGPGNISEDPMFCDPANDDFTLHRDSPCVGSGQGGANMGALDVGCGEELTLTIVPGDTVVAHRDTLCYHVICENHTPDYQSLWFKVGVRLPNGQPYGPIFGPARFGMFGNGISEGDMCHFVPPQAPVGDYWLFAEVYNLEVSARDSMAFTVTGEEALAAMEPWPGDWHTVVARLGDNDFIGDGMTGSLPTEFALRGNYPNPFNANTVIAYQLPTSSHIKLEVYNLLGRRVATLVDEKQEAGYRSVVWDASEVSSGLYFYKFTAGDFTETKRMMLVK